MQTARRDIDKEIEEVKGRTKKTADEIVELASDASPETVDDMLVEVDQTFRRSQKKREDVKSGMHKAIDHK